MITYRFLRLIVIIINFLVFIFFIISETRANDVVVYVNLNKIVFTKNEQVNVRIKLSNLAKDIKNLKVNLKIYKESKVIFSKQKSLSLNSGKNEEISFDYKPSNEYGYMAEVIVYEGQSVVAKDHKVFTVLSEWSKQIIMTIGLRPDLRFILNPDTEDDKLKNLADELANYGITVVQFYDTMPNYGVLYTDKETWVHPRNDFYRKRGLKNDIVISKAKIKKLINLLKDKGIHVCFYDEMGANDMNGLRKDFAIYEPIELINISENIYSLPQFFDLNKSFKNKGKMVKLYSEYSYDGNPYTMKDYYAEQLAKAVKEFGFDCMFHDSLTWLFEAAYFGYLYNGQKINLSPDEIGKIFIKTIEDKLKKIKPDFLNIINGGPYDNVDKTFGETRKHFLWTLEFPGNKSLIENVAFYPKTYMELNEALNSGFYNIVIYQPFFNIINPKNYKTFMALTFSNGVNIYHKNDYLANNLLNASIAEYNKFSILYGKFLYPKVKEIPNNLTLKFDKNFPYVFYRVGNYYVISMINVKPNLNIWGNNNNDIFQNLKLKIEGIKKVKKIIFLTPDNNKYFFGSELNFEINNGHSIDIHVPELDIWSIIVIEV